MNINEMDQRIYVFAAATRGYIARKKIIPGLKLLPAGGKLTPVPFPPMSRHAKAKYETLGAYYGDLRGKSNQGYRLHDGSVYAGDWEHYLMHGYGQQITKSGKVYEGEFRFHELSGIGRMIYSDGSVYTGSWKNGKIHGHGRMEFSDGS